MSYGVPFMSYLENFIRKIESAMQYIFIEFETTIP